jgi:hypothetical protein
VQPAANRSDADLLALARETRRIADLIVEPAIRDRLIEISNEILGLACPKEKAC